MSSAHGRWTSPDPINLTDKRLRSPSNTLNKYVYAANNPLKYVDPNGEDVTVFYKPGLRTAPFSREVGHVMLTAFNQQTGRVASLDFYPVDQAGVLSGSVPGMNGFLREPRDMTSEGYVSLTIRTSPEQAQKVIDWIKRFRNNPPDFNLLSSNCTTSCVEALKILGIDDGEDVMNPDTLWDNLYPKFSIKPGLPTLGHYPATAGVEYGHPRFPGMTTYLLSDLYYRLGQAEVNSRRKKEAVGCVAISDSATGTKDKTCN